MCGVGLRDRLRRLAEGAGKESIVLEDGSRFYYDRVDAGMDLFLHAGDCLRAHETPEDWPEPPEILRAMTRARDRRESYEKLFDSEVPAYDAESDIERGGSFTPFPYNVEAFIERGELVPRSLVVGYEPGEPIPDQTSLDEGL